VSTNTKKGPLSLKNKILESFFVFLDITASSTIGDRAFPVDENHIKKVCRPTSPQLHQRWLFFRTPQN